MLNVLNPATGETIADAVEAHSDELAEIEARNAGRPMRAMKADEMPHGGFKQSGYGKDLSMYGLEDYTVVKHVMASLA